MAQMAAAETITQVVGGKTRNLFGTTPDDVQQAVARLATVRQFSGFAHHFFARLTHKCLEYFLSRALPQQVGEGRRFTTLAQQAEFSAALEIHCWEAARIVEQYSGDWFSKHNWLEEGVSQRIVPGFTAHAMEKLVDELKAGARGHGH
jgi:hypothetical protein